MPQKMRQLWDRARRKDGSSKQSNSSASTPEPIRATANALQGLEVVSDPNNAIIDIVAVHGLNGHRQKTWTASNNIHWLRDLLPDDLPRARIMCWGYDANTHDSSRVSCQYLYDHARNLVSDLCRKRQLTNSTKRPIIFVAHSLGGIVVKSALIHSDASRQGALPEHRSIKLCTYGIIFMGTPHQGGNGVQLGQLLVNVASVFVAADDHILKHLKRDSEWLQQQLGQYVPISNDFVTKYAYEEYETPTALGHRIMVVPRASAVVPGHANAESIVIPKDHINMAKFISKEDSGYEKISEYLQIMVADASDQIQLRWEEEARITEGMCS
jgi:alpha-beta hydrolase superfamily lysophospholipase